MKNKKEDMEIKKKKKLLASHVILLKERVLAINQG